MPPKFTSPPDPTEFNLQVWEVVRQIPPGRVTAYGRVAARLPLPRGLTPADFAAWGPRWVGGALAACPPDVPWQRVLNAQGRISLRGAAADEQRTLLEAEGVEFDAGGRVDLLRFGWDAPHQERLW
jgi:methylated-DNA-protein-cysteine methyltransferase-like protein